MVKTIEEPKGIGFFSVKSGETHYAKLEPTIAAYINSSDMGINASRGQDFGWRLDPEWVRRVKAFRRDTTQMSILASRNSGQKPTTVQILYHLYGEDLRAYQEQVDENENPYEGEYQKAIADEPVAPATAEEMPEDIADEDLEPSDSGEIDTDAAAEAATSDKPAPKAKANSKK